MSSPTGHIGKNNTVELVSLSMWLEEPEGHLLLCAGLGTSLRCFGFAEAGLAALRFVQDTPPRVLLTPILPWLSTPGRQLLWQGCRSWGECGGKGWILSHLSRTPSCHLRKAFQASLLLKSAHDPGNQGTMGMWVQAAQRQQILEMQQQPFSCHGRPPTI